MKTKLFTISLLLAVIFISCSEEQITKTLLRSTPEKEGVSSQGILDFLTALDESGAQMHSFMLLRHGKVIAEGWWTPYAPELKHTMYSTSKSFVAMAVGYAISEGLLSTNDKVVSFFPEYLPDSVSPYLEAMNVKNLLCMSSGLNRDFIFDVDKLNDWAAIFFEAPVLYEPGSKFSYSSMDTYMLSLIVQRVTGQTVMDYLTPRLFEPLCIEDIDWELNPEGITVGGWGLRLKTEDMAKFGQLLLQKGVWNGKEVLPPAWIEEATAMQIDTHPEFTPEQRVGDDHAQGYGYQFWRCQNNTYRAAGAFGQLIVVMPDQDAVLIVTSKAETKPLEFAWKHLLPAMQNEPFPANRAANRQLKQRLLALALPIPENIPSEAETWRLPIMSTLIDPNNELKIGEIELRLVDGTPRIGGKIELILIEDPTRSMGEFSLKTTTKVNRIAFAYGTWQLGEVNRESPYLVPYQSPDLQPFKVAGAYRWTEEYRLELMLHYIETPHYEIYDFNFGKGDYKDVVIEYRNSLGRIFQFQRIEKDHRKLKLTKPVF